MGSEMCIRDRVTAVAVRLLVITGGLPTVRTRFLLLLPKLLLAEMGIVYVPADVGIPFISWVVALNDKPDGRLVAL